MILLRGSRGSSSPNTRPAICSYCPASWKEAHAGGAPLQKAGDTVSSMTSFVIRACSGSEEIRIPATTAKTFQCIGISSHGMLNNELKRILKSSQSLMVMPTSMLRRCLVSCFGRMQIPRHVQPEGLETLQSGIEV